MSDRPGGTSLCRGGEITPPALRATSPCRGGESAPSGESTTYSGWPLTREPSALYCWTAERFPVLIGFERGSLFAIMRPGAEGMEEGCGLLVNTPYDDV